ncbi:hypothetical protein [Alteromonas sp. RKMC-009]|uniref:hypothetical protein n=1 Tax=Alteromonas sp. RKMC-009 TaxID=2267264 RepID=UPI000E6894A9|nr:hypothetical protein [Alteromonas sp. RKMC-009]AYA64335.1 hypothetical protein DS731_10175 [Alteromonas sp. RKMC-009]
MSNPLGSNLSAQKAQRVQQKVDSLTSLDRLIQESQRKETALTDWVMGNRADTERRAQIDGRAWAGQTELGTLSGQAKQLANRVLSGGANILGDWASAPGNAEANQYLSLLDDATRQALALELNNKALSPEQQQLLNTPVNDSRYNQGGYSYNGNVNRPMGNTGQTPRQIFAKYQEALKGAGENADYFTKDTWIEDAYNPLNREAQSKQFGYAWEDSGIEEAKGASETAGALADLTVEGLKALLSNPASTFEYAAESAPSAFATAVPGLGQANSAAYALNTQAENLRKADKENKVVSTDKQAELAAEAALGGILDFAGDSATRAISGIKKLGKTDVTKATTEATKEVAKESVASAKEVLTKAAKGTGGMATEGVTEAVQTAIENDALGEDFDLKEDGRDIYEAGMIGVGASGATAAAVRTPQAVATSTNAVNTVSSAAAAKVGNLNEARKQRTEEAQKVADEQVRAEIDSGNYTTLVENSLSDGENTEKVSIDDGIRNIRARHEAALTSDATQEQKEALGDEALIEATQLQSAIAEKLESLETEITNTSDPKVRASLEKQADKLVDQENRVTDAVNNMFARQETISNTAQAVDSVVNAEQRDDKFEVDAQRIFKSEMYSPESITLEDVESLLQSRHWTPEERTRLQNAAAVKEAALAATEQRTSSTVDGVNNDLVKGRAAGTYDKADRGATSALQYQAEITQLIDAGDTNTARQKLRRLEALANSQTRKADDFERAFAPWSRGGIPDITDEDQRAIDYVAANYKMRGSRKDGSRSYQIYERSGRMVKSVRAEANLLNAVVNNINGLMPAEEQVSAPVTESVATPTAAPEAPVTEVAETTAQPEVTAATTAASTENTPADAIPDTITPEEQESQSVSVSDDTSTEDTTVESVGLTDEELPAQDEPELSDTEKQLSEMRLNENRLDATIREAKRKLNNKALIRSEAMDNLGFLGEPNTPIEKQAVKRETRRITQELLDTIATAKSDISDSASARKYLEGREEGYHAADRLLAGNKTLNKFFKKSDRVRSIIAEVPHVIQRLRELPSLLLTDSDSVSGLTTQQKNAVEHFTAFAPGFAKIINQMAKPTDPSYDTQNLHNTLLENGKYPESVTAAMSMAAYNWVATSSMDALFNKKATVGQMFGVKEEKVNHDLHQLMMTRGLPEDWITRQLGRDIIKMLGLSLNDENGSTVHLSRLEFQLGQVTLSAMLNAQLVEGVQTSWADIKGAASKKVNAEIKKSGRYTGTDKSPALYNTFLPKYNPDAPLFSDEQLDGRARDIYEVNKDTGRILSEALSIGNPTRMPSFKPITKLPAHMKRTIKKLPQKMQDAILKAQQTPMGISSDTDTLVNLLGDAEQKLVFNFHTEEEMRLAPKRKRKAMEAVNAGLQRELDNYNEFREAMELSKGGLGKPFYLPMESWKYGRLGYSSSVNPQTSKIHRGLIGVKAWKRDIKLDNEQAVNLFKLGVAQGFGIDIDKMQIESSLGQFGTLVTEDTRIQEAAEAAVALVEGGVDPLSAEGQIARALVTDVVRQYKEGTHTLRALMNYGRYLQALDDPDEKSFSTDLWVELDGVTNGVAIGTMLYGNGTADNMKEMLKKGGFFFDGQRSLGNAIEGGQRDFYQTLTDRWNQLLQEDLSSYPAEHPIHAVMKTIMDTVTKNGTDIPRALGKEPLMQRVYGAGDDTIEAILGQEFLDKFDDRIEKAIVDNDPQGSLTALQALNRELQRLTNSKENFIPVTKGMSVKDMRDLEMPNYQQNMIADAVIRNMAAPLAGAIDEQFNDFKENRQNYVDGMQQLNATFADLTDMLMEDARQALIKAGKLEKNQPLPRKVFNDLMSKFHTIMPNVQYAYSQNAEEQTQVAEIGETIDQKQNASTSFAKNIPLKLKGAWRKGLSAKARRDTVTREIGVGSGVQNIHAFDAAMAAHLLTEVGAFNVHDGFPVSVLDAVKAGQSLNSEMAAQIGKLNPYQHLLDQMLAMEEAIESLVQAGRISKSKQGKLVATLYGRDTWQNRQKDILPSLQKNAEYQNDVSKKVMDDLEYLVQYNFEGAGYETEKGRNNRALDEAGNPVPSRTRSAPEAPKPAETTKTTQVKEEAEQKNIRTRNDYGELRDPSVAVTDPFQILFEKAVKETTNVREVLHMLMKDRKVKTLNAGILKMLAKHVPPDLTFKVVGDEAYNSVNNMMTVALGVYDPNDREIMLRSSDYKHSGTTLETVAHELIHAMTSDLVNRVQNGEIKDPQSVKAVEKLEELRTEIAEKASKAGIRLNSEATRNIKELIAYGFTNREFIEQLKNIKTKQRRNGGLIDMFTSFVSRITNAIFKGESSPKTDSAVRQVIELGASLIESQARLLPRGTESVYAADMQRIRKMTPAELVQAFAERNADRDTDHTEYLKEIQQSLINSVAGLNGKELFDAEEALGDEFDQFVTHLNNNTTPFVSNLRDTFPMPEEELYVAEQLESVLGSSLNTYSFERTQLRKAWLSAKEALTWESFLPFEQAKLDPSEVAKAKAKYDYLFSPSGLNAGNIEQSDIAGRNIDSRQADYLTRFAVVGATHLPVRQLLENIENRASDTPEGSIYRQVQHYISRILGRLVDLLNGNVNLSRTVRDAHDSLLGRLAQKNYDTRRKLDVLERTEQKLRSGADDLIKQGVKAAVNSKAFGSVRTTRVPFVAATAGLVELAVKDRVGKVTQMIKDDIKNNKQTPQSNVALAVDEVIGDTVNNEEMLKQLRYTNRDIEQKRTFVSKNLSQIIHEGFKTRLNKHQSKAVTKALIKSDVPSLLAHGYTMEQVAELLASNEAVHAEAAKLEQQLSELPHFAKYVAHSKALGFYMARNVATTRNLIKNAYGIANMFGYGLAVSQEEAQAAEPLIEQLASLYAIKYTDAASKALALEVVRTENARKDGQNGAEYLLRQYQDIREESQEQLFHGDPALMTKGFISEIHNPYVSLDWAVPGSEKAKQLEAMGYIKRDGLIAKDRMLDNEQHVHLYTVRDGGMRRRVTGVASLTEVAAKGTNYVQAAFNADNGQMYRDFGKVLPALTRNAVDDSAERMDIDFDPETVKEAMMIPTFSPDGRVTDYRYEMSEENRDKILEKQYDVGEVVGGIAGSIVDRTNTKSRNEQMIDVLYDQYANDKNPTASNYVKVSADAKDPVIREYWDLLPRDAKLHARDKFGRPHLMVRRDLLNLTFGYRKWSAAEIFKADRDKQHMLTKAFRTAVEMTLGKVFGDKLILRIQQTENVVQTIVKMIKDSIIVKSLFTTVFNIVSNGYFLNLAGVPLRQGITDTVKGWRYASAYNTLKKRQYALQRQLAVTGTGSKRESLRSELAEVTTEMSANPVHELMEAGLFQTIVEDIDTAKDPFSYKTKLTQRIDDVLTNKRLGPVNKFGKFLFVTQDTQFYDMLNQPIQMSDFAARYAQYRHLTETAENKLSKSDALAKVSRNFVNYDIPTSQGLQYLNDMGLLYFTKYALRIQRPVYELFREQPASTLANMFLIGNMGIPSPVDAAWFQSSILDKIGNPVSTGLNAWDEILPINGILHAMGFKS